MKKRILISILLLLIAATLSLTGYLLVQNRLSALGEALENAVYADAQPRDACTQIANAWDRCAVPAQIFLLHSDLCELRAAVRSLPDLAQEPALFRDVCVRGLHLLEGIQDSLTPSAENIL